MVRLVKVIKNSGSTKTTVYEGDDGNTYTLQGDLAVRANNPGNISPSKANRQFWIDNFGAIGFVPSSAGEPDVAIFPDVESGRAAQRYLWSTGSYQNLTIGEAAKRWATDAYPDKLAAAAGVPVGTLVKDLSPAQMDAMFAAQAAAEGAPNLTVLDAAGNKIDPAIITGGHPVPPGLMPNAPADILQNLKDRVAIAQGYSEIAPTPKDRPNYFNETGAPPIPAVRGDVLADLKGRVDTLARSGALTPAAMGATPRLVMSGDQPVGRIDPPLDGLPEEEAIFAGGIGSLLTDPMSPAALNPRPPLLAETNNVQPLSPTSAPTFQQGNLGRGQPVAPVKPGEGLQAPASPASGPAAGRPGGATSVPMDGGKIDNASPTVAPVVRQQEMTTVNGKTVPVGATVIQGDVLKMVVVGPDGKGALRDVQDLRDDWLRQNVDQNAPLLFEESVLGNAARMLAGPQIKQGMADAGQAAMDGLGGLFGEALGTVGKTVQQARDTIGGMFSPPARPQTVAPVSANANRTEARSEQSSQRIAPRSTVSVPLTPPTQTANAAERNAISAYTPKPAAPTMTSVPVTTTVRNPEYDSWVQKYGDGSQVQTAATGGMITKNQLAAIQNVHGAVQAPIKAPPPAPPKTIQVVTTKMVPVTAPQPIVKNKTTGPEVRKASGTTSWGQPKTAADGTSWAANYGSG